MAKVKLFGLVLIITTSILALAAISTQTNRIRIGSFPSQSHNTADGSSEPLLQTQLPDQFDLAGQQPPHNSVQFVSIPIVLPLCVAGFLGIMLWLTPLKTKPTKFSVRRRSARRRK